MRQIFWYFLQKFVHGLVIAVQIDTQVASIVKSFKEWVGVAYFNLNVVLNRVWEYRIEYRPDTYLDTFFVSFHCIWEQCICIGKVSILFVDLVSDYILQMAPGSDLLRKFGGSLGGEYYITLTSAICCSFKQLAAVPLSTKRIEMHRRYDTFFTLHWMHFQLLWREKDLIIWVFTNNGNLVVFQESIEICFHLFVFNFSAIL